MSNIMANSFFQESRKNITNTLLKSVIKRLDETIEVIKEKDPVFYRNCYRFFPVLKQPQRIWKRYIEFYRENGEKVLFYLTVVIHNTVLGPPKGGLMLIDPQILGEDFFESFDRLRGKKITLDDFWNFCCKWVTEEMEAFSIVTTLKLALYSLPLGGGTCGLFLGELKDNDGEVILLPVELSDEEKKRLVREVGYLLTKEGVMGYDAYSPGPDIGTDGTMMDHLADGHFRALAEMEKIKSKELLEKLKNIRETEIVWTSGLPYLKKADEFARYIREHGDTEQNVPELGAITSKTYGGLEGRVEATAFAVVEITNFLVWYRENPEDYLKIRIGRERKNYLKGKIIVIQGFGKIGLNAAELFTLRGAKVIAVSEYDQKKKKVVAIYNTQGLDIKKLVEHKKYFGGISGFAGAQSYEDPSQLLEEKADILLLAAVENQVNIHNAEKIQAFYVISAANAAITHEGYHILRKKGKIIGSDSIVKSGGIIGSYLEKIQNSQNDKWEKQDVFENILIRVENVLKNNMIKNQVEKHGVDLSIAGDIVAIKRIMSTMETKSNLQKGKECFNKSIIIGIFDSGQGGVITAEKLNRTLLEGDIKLLLYTDKANFPFGPKSREEINAITLNAVHEIYERCRIVKKPYVVSNKIIDKIPYIIKLLLIKLRVMPRNVIICFACNTVDTVIDHSLLLKKYPQIQFVGPIKNTLARIKKLPKSSKIGIIGTMGTKKSGIYKRLAKEAGYDVIVKATPLLAVLSEMLYKKSFDTEEKQKEFYKIARDIIQQNLEGFINENHITHVCLACTHYDYLKTIIEDLFGDIQFISTVESIIDEVVNILKQRFVQIGEKELEFIKTSKRGKSFDRLLIEGIISSPNLTASEKVMLGEKGNQIKEEIQNKLASEDIREVDTIKFFDKKNVEIKCGKTERAVRLL